MCAFVGDGGFAMLMAEFLTAARHQLPIKVFINNNGAYGQILWEQMVLGYPEFGVRHSSVANYAPWGTACGAFAAKVERPGDLLLAALALARLAGPYRPASLSTPADSAVVPGPDRDHSKPGPIRSPATAAPPPAATRRRGGLPCVRSAVVKPRRTTRRSSRQPNLERSARGRCTRHRSCSCTGP